MKKAKNSVCWTDDPGYSSTFEHMLNICIAYCTSKNMTFDINVITLTVINIIIIGINISNNTAQSMKTITYVHTNVTFSPQTANIKHQPIITQMSVLALEIFTNEY